MEWLILLIAIVLGVPAVAWLAQDQLIFFPQPIVSTAHIGTEIAPLEIVSSDGTRLHGWMRIANATPAPVAILLRLLITLGIVAIAGAFVTVGRLLAAGEWGFLRRALADTFAAETVQKEEDSIPTGG